MLVLLLVDYLDAGTLEVLKGIRQRNFNSAVEQNLELSNHCEGVMFKSEKFTV